MDFKRNISTIDGLNLGLKTTTDKKILKLLESHSKYWDAPMVIEHLEITKDNFLAVYYAPTNPNITFNEVDLYWRSHLRESNLNFFIEASSPLFENHPSLDYMKIMKYEIKPMYINSFEIGLIYKLDHDGSPIKI